MKRIEPYILFVFFLYFLSSCSEPYTPDTQEEDQQYVVEGFIESGEGSLPAFVMITKSIPFLSTIDLSTFNTLFVRGANVTVNDGVNEIQLTELCFQDLSPELQMQAASILGLPLGTIDLDICAYVDLLNQIDRKEGGKYDLTIEVEDNLLTASTTIPEFVPIDSIRWDNPPGDPNDTLALVYITVEDPANVPTFYRYQTEDNNEGLNSPFSSVTNDVLFDGKSFEFPLSSAQKPGEGFDPNTFGLYRSGDSITIKWMNLDEAHFNFWNTLEFNRNNAGPFSSYTRVSSNVNGALGVWGGYAVGYYREYVPFN